jgi:Spy/CpxP family protein refolding chaperone
MKRVVGSFAVLALTAAGVVAAQTTSPPTPPSDRSTYPSNSTPSTSSSSSSGNYSNSGKSHDQQMKDCMTQQQANNPSMSKSDIKKACKSQLSNSSSGTPHQ